MSGSRQYRKNQKTRMSRHRRRRLDRRDRAEARVHDTAEEDRETLQNAKRRVEDAKLGMAIRKHYGI